MFWLKALTIRKPKTSGSSNKARLCVRGDMEVPDVDFNDTFAPTANSTTVRLLFALLAHLNLWIVQLDVKNAFATAHLNTPLQIA